jgi:hypothetical protein
MAIVSGSHVRPALFGRARTEAALSQGMLMARGAHARGAMHYSLMLNAERWTMPDGESTPGIWGEGFIDRRHPHSVVHEAMATLVAQRRRMTASLAAGKGVVPFGTDDPMVRPFVKYVANHHLAQVLERAQVIGALRWRESLSLEGALFNGDEPASPTSAPQWDRFGDSRAVRLSAWLIQGALELQISEAHVRSPESPAPSGFDQRKASASARFTPRGSHRSYTLVEWARTGERFRDRALFDYQSVLLESSLAFHGVRIGARAEQTTRPEEERLSPFRTPRPHLDNIVKGLTRWRLFSAQLQMALPARVSWVSGTAVLEATHARSAPQIVPTVVNPRDFLGSDRAWHFMAGVRLGLGAMPSRVGRYGAAVGASGTLLPLGMAHASDAH